MTRRDKQIARQTRSGQIHCPACPGNRVTSECTHIPISGRRARRMAEREERKRK